MIYKSIYNQVYKSIIYPIVLKNPQRIVYYQNSKPLQCVTPHPQRWQGVTPRSGELLVIHDAKLKEIL